jgi:hypothetical protein
MLPNTINLRGPVKLRRLALRSLMHRRYNLDCAMGTPLANEAEGKMSLNSCPGWRDHLKISILDHKVMYTYNLHFV